MLTKTQICFLLLLITLASQALGIQNEFLIDDFIYLNYHYAGFFQNFADFFTKIPPDVQHYMPLNFFFNQMFFEILPHNPIAFHLANTLLFFIQCLLTFLLLEALTLRRDLAFFVTLLFCIHPMNREIISHATFSSIIISNIFIQTSLLLFYKSAQNKLSDKTYLASVCFYTLSLLCFEGNVLTIFYLILIQYFFKNLKAQKIFINLLPFLIISFLFFVLGAFSVWQHADWGGKLIHYHSSTLLSVGILAQLIFWYISNLIFPLSITWIYNILPQINSILSWSMFLILALLWSGIKLSQWGKNIKSFALLWFLSGFLFVPLAMFGHSDMGFIVEPYWFYSSSLGFFILTAQIIVYLQQRYSKATGYIFFAIIFLFWGISTQIYHIISRTEEKYCQFWNKVTPTNPIPLMSLAKISATRGDHASAQELYERILKTSPGNHPQVMKEMATLYIDQKKFVIAEEYLRQAITQNPAYANAYNALGTIYSLKKEYNTAKIHFSKAVELDGSLVMARLNLADVLLLQNNFKEAGENLSYILKIQPSHPERKEILMKLALVDLKEEKSSMAMQTYELLLKENSQLEVYLAVIQILVNEKNDSLADHFTDQALLHYSKNKELYLIKGVLTANKGALSQAIVLWKKGSSLDPTDPRFKNYIDQANSLQKIPQQNSSKPN